VQKKAYNPAILRRAHLVGRHRCLRKKVRRLAGEAFCNSSSAGHRSSSAHTSSLSSRPNHSSICGKTPSGDRGHNQREIGEAADKPAFRNRLRFRRCLIPAGGFHEWTRKGSKQQFCLKRKMASYSHSLGPLCGWSPRKQDYFRDSLAIGPRDVMLPFRESRRKLRDRVCQALVVFGMTRFSCRWAHVVDTVVQSFSPRGRRFETTADRYGDVCRFVSNGFCSKCLRPDSKTWR